MAFCVTSAASCLIWISLETALASERIWIAVASSRMLPCMVLGRGERDVSCIVGQGRALCCRVPFNEQQVAALPRAYLRRGQHVQDAVLNLRQLLLVLRALHHLLNGITATAVWQISLSCKCKMYGCI